MEPFRDSLRSPPPPLIGPRAELYEDFVRIFRESKAESLCVGAIPAALEVMKGLSSPDGAPPPSSSTNPTSDRLD